MGRLPHDARPCGQKGDSRPDWPMGSRHAFQYIYKKKTLSHKSTTIDHHTPIYTPNGTKSNTLCELERLMKFRSPPFSRHRSWSARARVFHSASLGRPVHRFWRLISGPKNRQNTSKILIFTRYDHCTPHVYPKRCQINNNLRVRTIGEIPSS